VENTGWERVRVVCFYIRSSEGSSSRLCRLKTVSVGPITTSIDYVLVHTRYMESYKLSSFDGR
jgi:hypothetical protein